MREIMRQEHGMYERSKGKASPTSYARTKAMMKEGTWDLVRSSSTSHPVLLRSASGSSLAKKMAEEKKRKDLLAAVSAFRPAETVLEISTRGSTETAALMKQKQEALVKAKHRAQLASTSAAAAVDEAEESDPEQDGDKAEVEMADEEEIAAVFDSYITHTTSMRKKHGEPEPARPSTTPKGKRPGQHKRLGARFNGKTVGRVKNELKTVDQIRKARQVAERKKEKNARPSRGGGKGGRKGRR